MESITRAAAGITVAKWLKKNGYEYTRYTKKTGSSYFDAVKLTDGKFIDYHGAEIWIDSKIKRLHIRVSDHIAPYMGEEAYDNWDYRNQTFSKFLEEFDIK